MADCSFRAPFTPGSSTVIAVVTHRPSTHQRLLKAVDRLRKSNIDSTRRGHAPALFNDHRLNNSIMYQQNFAYIPIHGWRYIGMPNLRWLTTESFMHCRLVHSIVPDRLIWSYIYSLLIFGTMEWASKWTVSLRTSSVHWHKRSNAWWVTWKASWVNVVRMHVDGRRAIYRMQKKLIGFAKNSHARNKLNQLLWPVS
jgi:hypothetical protein